MAVTERVRVPGAHRAPQTRPVPPHPPCHPGGVPCNPRPSAGWAAPSVALLEGLLTCPLWGARTCLRTKPSSWQPCPGGASMPASTLLPGQLSRCGLCCRDSGTSPSPALGGLRQSSATATRGPCACAYATACT